MVLPTIQLLRVTLIPRLLLLIPVTGLLMITTLIGLVSLIALEARIRTAATVTRPVKPWTRTAGWTLIIPEEIRVFEFPHDETILPEVRGQNLLCPVLWAGLV